VPECIGKLADAVDSSSVDDPPQANGSALLPFGWLKTVMVATVSPSVIGMKIPLPIPNMQLPAQSRSDMQTHTRDVR
jgi:hypothetical protein